MNVESEPHRDHPLAYHLTIGAYGTRLYGRDERIFEDHHEHDPENERIIGLANDWRQASGEELQSEPVVFDDELRHRTENELIPAVCEREGWTLHACAAASNHIHVVLSATNYPDGATVRKWFKRQLTKAINETCPIPTGADARWWAKGGSAKAVWTQEYHDRVCAYIRSHRTLP